MNTGHRVTIEGDDLRFDAAHMASMGDEVEPLHGHGYRLRIELEGTLAVDSWVFDFRKLKALANTVCKELDHRFLLQAQSGVVKAREMEDGWEVIAGDRRYLLPKADVLALPVDNLTAERLAEWICGRLKEELRSIGAGNVERISVTVHEGPGQSATYSETTGAV